MSVSSLSTSSALSALSALSSSAASRSGGVPGHVRTAADALGMSTSDVVSALSSGKSLDDLAEEQGVSHEDLVAALKAGAPEDLRNSDDADAVVERLASQTGLSGPGGVGGPGGAGGPQGPPPPPPSSTSSSSSSTTGVYGSSLTSAQQSTLSALSDLLGTDPGSLLSSLQSGTDLTDLLQQAGVGLDDLAGKLEEGLLVDARA